MLAVILMGAMIAQASPDVSPLKNIAPLKTEITVTAEAGQKLDTAKVPQAVSVLTQETVSRLSMTTLSEAVRELPGVSDQRTSSNMGGYFVRGLTGSRVSVYRDGVRFTTSAQRGGVSTFANVAESSSVEAIEVLRGPNTAQYGSDSLGGVVHLVSREARFGQRLGGEVSTFYQSAAHAFGGNVLLAGGTDKLAILLNLASRRVNTARTGRGLDSRAAVTRFLGLPSDVLGERLPDTAFTQYGGMLRGRWAITPRRQLVFSHSRDQQDGSKRYDQLLGGDGNLIADLRNLMVDFGHVRFDEFQLGPLTQLSVTASWNTQREERVNQGGNGNPRGTITHNYERTKAWGLAFFGSRELGRHTLVAGGDGTLEGVVAPAYTLNPISGAFAAVRPRVPDGARELQYGLYAQDGWEPFANRRLRLTGALRFGGASYRSRATNAPVVNERPAFPDDSLSVRAWTGRAGGTYRLLGPLSVHATYGRGYRVPNMTDLGTAGLQGNGVYEVASVDLARRGALVGSRADDRAVSTGRPVIQLVPESSDNFDYGARFVSGRFRASVTAFSSGLHDVIASQTLILPAGAVGTSLGAEAITRQSATGLVYVAAATGPVQTRANLTGARFRGVEQTIEWKATRGLTIRQNFSAVRASDAETGLPPDLEGGIPPRTMHLALNWQGRRAWWVEPYATVAGRQDRLSSLALADRRIGAARSREDIGRFFENGARARGLVSPGGLLIPTGETLAQVQTRVLGAPFSGPLFAAVPGYGLFGVRGGVNVGERTTLFADFSNIADRNYRGLGWGIDGAGRSFAIRLTRTF